MLCKLNADKDVTVEERKAKLYLVMQNGINVSVCVRNKAGK